MIKFNPNVQRWLKGLHVLFCCLWTGSCFTLIGMQMGLSADSGASLWGMDISKKFVDDFILIPGAIGAFLTGLLLSWLTNWGFIKYTWIVIKWLVTIGCILFGSFFLGPWLNAMPEITKLQGIYALENPLYLQLKQIHTWGAFAQTIILVITVFLSILKPWGRFGRMKKNIPDMEKEIKKAYSAKILSS